MESSSYLILASAFVALIFVLYVLATLRYKRLLRSAGRLFEENRLLEAFPFLLKAYVAGLQKGKRDAKGRIGLSQKRSLLTQKRVLSQLCDCIESNPTKLAMLPIKSKEANKIRTRIFELGRCIVDGTIAQDEHLLLLSGIKRPSRNLYAVSCPICFNWIKADDVNENNSTLNCPICSYPIYCNK